MDFIFGRKMVELKYIILLFFRSMGRKDCMNLKGTIVLKLALFLASRTK